MIRNTCNIIACLVAALFLLPSSAPAQITTGSITGRVTDSTGGVVPGAHVILVSETRGTKSAPAVTNDSWICVLWTVVAWVVAVKVTAVTY